MKQWCFILLLAFSPLDGFQRIAFRNRYVQEAEIAYQQHRYEEAIFYYERIRQAENGNPSNAILLNLAHSYFQVGDYSHADPLYRVLLKTPDISLKSIVAAQLGVIEAKEGNYTKALNFYKQAITTDERNKEARYNYELVQKYLILHPEKRKTPPPPQKRENSMGQGGTVQPDAQGNVTSSGTGANSSVPSGAPGTNGTGTRSSSTNNDGTGTPKPQATGNTPGNTPGSTQGGTGNLGRSNGTESAGIRDTLLQTRIERLQKIKMTPEKARQILDAMKEEEAQYLQQLPRKKTTRPKRGAPNW